MWPLASKLVVVMLVAMLASCSAPKPVSVDKAFRVCAENESPELNDCKRLGPTAPITIRGIKE